MKNLKLSLAAATLATLAAAALVSAPVSAAPKFSPDDLTKVLKKYVDARGYVNYDALAKDRADLDRYLTAIETTSPANKPELFPTQNDKLAYYINAYNAQTIKGVLARGPEKVSVWGGGLFGIAFFTEDRVVLGGAKPTSLKALEDDVVRDGFKDPRIHAALNCASKGCPRLPQEAFEGELLDKQLDAGMTEFVGETRNVTVDDAAKTVTLSKIFDWFKKDFTKYEATKGNASGNQIDYINRYRGALPKLNRDYKIKFFDYDKAVNRQ